MTARGLTATLLAILLILLVLIWCAPRKARQIEAEIQQSTATALRAGGLNEVKAVADGQWLSLTGAVTSAEARQRAQDIAASVPGVTRVDNRIQVVAAVAPPPAAAPPFELTLAHDGQSLTLSGNVPDAATRNAIIERARAIFGEDNVRADIGLAGGPPGKIAEIVNQRLLPGLAQLETGRAIIGDSRLTLTGVADSEPKRLALMESLSANLPSPWLPVFSIQARASDADDNARDCERRFSESLKAQRIHFATNQAEIRPDSYPLLDQLAKAAATCPESRIEIAGHTDSAGAAEYNRKLSQRRARAVADYLFRKGIPRERLVARGYGESRPIASNATPEGMRKNRRIEMRVLKAEN